MARYNITMPASLVLQAIADGTRYGFDIADRTGLQTGTVYPALRRLEELSGEKITRVPRGYPPDHPAAEFLKFRQFFAGADFPASLAYSPKFYPTLVATFKAMMPLVRFLNGALTK